MRRPPQEDEHERKNPLEALRLMNPTHRVPPPEELDAAYEDALAVGCAEDLPNALGFLRRVPGSKYYREPARGSGRDEPTAEELRGVCWKLKVLARRARGNPAAPGAPRKATQKDRRFVKSVVRAARKYRTFHEVEPHTVTERTCWVPGELVLVGAGVEINYKINVVDSAKDNGASYVHPFEDNVKIYRRARKGEQPDVVWKNFPNELSVLGYALEFSFVDPEDGETYETKPAQHDKLATTPDGKTLVIVGSSGVKFVARGGKMKVTNWIYH